MKDAIKNKTLLISVDLDMWYHVRWATGGPHSFWPTTEDARRDFYGSANPPEMQMDLERLVETILELFHSFSIKATFFILGETALSFPLVIKKIHMAGHEIASHGMHHTDAAGLDERTLRASVKDSKKILEDCCGAPVFGFRFPNLVYGKREFEVLTGEGYTYDSSICFSRRLFGKFGVSEKPRNNPYHPAPANPFKTGDSTFWEIPIPVFPRLRLSAASGIATRLVGRMWSEIALDAALRNGDAMYYFHPYDLHYVKGLEKTCLSARLFIRNTGQPFKRRLEKLLQRYSQKVRLTCVSDWLAGQ
jgi:hypothetical protein